MKKMMMLGTLAALVMLMLAAAPAFAAGKHNNERKDNDRRDNDRDIVFVDNSDFNDHFFCDFPFCDDNDFDHFNNFDNFDNFDGFDNFGNEQEVQSGAASQAILVEGGGANSNQCVGIQGVNNTGNAVTNTGIVQGAPLNNGFFNDGFDHRFDDNFFDHRFDDNFFNHGFNGGEVEVQDSGNFTINPSQSVSCNQQVNQAATAA
jgi:hypothetical protein